MAFRIRHRRESIVAGDSVIAAPQPDSAFNDRAIGQLSSIIITLIRILPHRDVSFRPFTASIFIYPNINPPPAEYTSSRSKIIGEPRVDEYYEPSTDATFRPSRGEMGPRLRVARLRTWSPSPKFQRNSLLSSTHQLRNIVEITPVRYKAMSVRQMWCRSKFLTAPTSF